jgi:hypothetical protein
LLYAPIIWEIIPNPGKIKIYTSGWPKNQNKCWYRIGFPPPEGSKNLVLRLRSVNSIVIPPARTGSLKINSTAVILTAHRNKGSLSIVKVLEAREVATVVKKLIEPKIELIPAK